MRTFTIFKTAFLSIFLFFFLNSVSFAQDCTLSVDFENNWDGSNYTVRTVTDQWGEWGVSGVVTTTDANDRVNSGEKSIRLRGNSGDNCHFQMNFDKANGVGDVKFYYASYSTHSGGTINVYYSANGGNNWADGGSVVAPAWDGNMIQAVIPINVSGNVRIKIAREGGLSNGTSVNIDDFCLTDFICPNCVSAPTFNPPSGIQSEPIDVTISCSTPDATIRYTVDGSDPNDSSPVYATPIHIEETTVIKAQASKAGMETSSISTAEYSFLQGITTLAALRALAPEYNGASNVGKITYLYTGEAVITQTQAFNNIKYIQDETAAIMIFDQKNIIGAKDIGDKITNLTGTLTNYFGMLELIPTEGCTDLGWFNKVPTTIITASQLDFDHNNPIQAKVITINDVLFTTGGAYATGTYYNLKQNNVVYDSVVYTDNYDADYMGQNIPTLAVNLNGVILFKGSTANAAKNRIVPLDYSNDVILGIETINPSVIKLSPNPANNYVNILTDNPMKLEVYSILGNLIAVEQLREGKNTISISQYPAGLYMMKMMDTQTGQTFVQKLVVQ